MPQQDSFFSQRKNFHLVVELSMIKFMKIQRNKQDSEIGLRFILNTNWFIQPIHIITSNQSFTIFLQILQPEITNTYV